MRPIGFMPAEITALVNEAVVDQHAGECAFLWTQRARFVSEPNYALRDVTALDERVEANLDGLRIAGERGLARCEAAFDAHSGPGEAFALVALTASAGDREHLQQMIARCAPQKLHGAAASALAWVDDVRAWASARELLTAPAPELRTIGLAAYAITRRAAGLQLEAAQNADYPPLRARALRAAGELKRAEDLELLRAHMRDEDEPCRFWSAWSLTLLGSGDGIPTLFAIALANTPFSRPALEIALRGTRFERAKSWLAELRAQGLTRLAINAAGIAGDPVEIPALIQAMDVPAHARAAGEAFTAITGIDLVKQDLVRDVPLVADDDDELALDEESNFPWPDVARVSRAWSEARADLRDGVRYLAGKPIDNSTCRQVLLDGTQPQRAAAALELALRTRDAVLFETRARGDRQREQLQR